MPPTARCPTSSSSSTAASPSATANGRLSAAGWPPAAPLPKSMPSGRKMSPDWSPATRRRFWKRAAPSWKSWRGFRCRRAAAGKRRTKGSSAGRTASAGHPSFTDIRSGVIVKLLLLLLENGLAEDEGDRETLAFARQKPVCSADGAALGIDFEDEPSGKMKWSCGTLSLEEGRLQLGFSARCPLTVDPSKVFPAVLKSCEAAGFTAVQTRFLPGNHFPKSTPVIQTLDEVFRQTTELDWPPQVFSAGTHARQLPSAVAYGREAWREPVSPIPACSLTATAAPTSRMNASRLTPSAWP